MLAYWWVKEDMTASYGDEPAWTVGEKRSLEGEIIICKRGYHSSPTVLDAFKYLTGPILCLVEIGEPESNPDHTDKYVSRTRQLVKAVDMSVPLRLLTCDVADRENAAYERETGKKVPQEILDSVIAGRRFAKGEITKKEMEKANRKLFFSYYSYCSSYYSSYYASCTSYYTSYYYSRYSKYQGLLETFQQLALEKLGVNNVSA